MLHKTIMNHFADQSSKLPQYLSILYIITTLIKRANQDHLDTQYMLIGSYCLPDRLYILEDIFSIRESNQQWRR